MMSRQTGQDEHEKPVIHAPRAIHRETHEPGRFSSLNGAQSSVYLLRVRIGTVGSVRGFTSSTGIHGAACPSMCFPAIVNKIAGLGLGPAGVVGRLPMTISHDP